MISATLQAFALSALLATSVQAKPRLPSLSRVPVSPASLGHQYPEHVLAKRNNDNQYLPPSIEGYVTLGRGTCQSISDLALHHPRANSQKSIKTPNGYTIRYKNITGSVRQCFHSCDLERDLHSARDSAT